MLLAVVATAGEVRRESRRRRAPRAPPSVPATPARPGSPPDEGRRGARSAGNRAARDPGGRPRPARPPHGIRSVPCIPPTGSSPPTSGATPRPGSTTPSGRTGLDRGQPGDAAGARRPYFAALDERVDAMRAGDLLLFVDWRGDPDERLTGEPGSEVAALFADAARRGVDVRGLVWRSHWDQPGVLGRARTGTSARTINAAGGECVLDMRVRARRLAPPEVRRPAPPRPTRRATSPSSAASTCATAGATTPSHAGDPQPQTDGGGLRPATRRGTTSSSRITGPAVGDVETVFRERWEDPQALSRSPIRWAGDALRRDQARRRPLPPQQPDPAPTGPHPVQLLRTYPTAARRLSRSRRDGERSVARGYTKALAQRPAPDLRRGPVPLVPRRERDSSPRRCAANPTCASSRSLPHYPDQDGA